VTGSDPRRCARALDVHGSRVGSVATASRQAKDELLMRSPMAETMIVINKPDRSGGNVDKL